MHSQIRRAQLGPSNFGFGDSIVRELRIWLDAWTANFAGAPAEDSHTRRLGFDVRVDRRYTTYLKNRSVPRTNR